MHGEQLLLRDLTIAVAAAWLAGIVAVRLRLNAMLGYLAAGAIIGPFTPGYSADPAIIQGLASLGLIFLLFSLGLDFSFEELHALGTRAILGNGAAMTISCIVAWGAARLLHFVHPITAAITTAVSSTAVGAALLKDWREEKTRIGKFTISQQVVQDVVAVLLLVITTVPLNDITPARIALPLITAIGFVSAAIFMGQTVLKRVVQKTLSRASSERLFIAFAAIALLAAWLGEIVGLSYEFGAFVAGAVISETSGSKMIVSIIAPFRALFVALFFVSIGMLLDFHVLQSNVVLLICISLVLLIVRTAAWTLIGKAWHLSQTDALASAIAMASLGEFNVVLIDEASNALRIGEAEKQLLLSVTLLTIVFTFISGPLIARLLNHRATAIEPSEGTIDGIEPRVAIIGYGRVGRTVANILRDAGVPFTALEHDKQTIRIAKRIAHKEVLFGDALDPIALDRIITPTTEIVVTTTPVASVNLAVTRHVSSRYNLQIVARAAMPPDIAHLEAVGASIAMVPETEGALVFAETILNRLRFPPEDIDIWIEKERRIGHSTVH